MSATILTFPSDQLPPCKRVHVGDKVKLTDGRTGLVSSLVTTDETGSPVKVHVIIGGITHALPASNISEIF